MVKVEVVVVVVDLLGMPGGQQIILIDSPSAQMYQPGQDAQVPTAYFPKYPWPNMINGEGHDW